MCQILAHYFDATSGFEPTWGGGWRGMNAVPVFMHTEEVDVSHCSGSLTISISGSLKVENRFSICPNNYTTVLLNSLF